jgi:hypothetical protein
LSRVTGALVVSALSLTLALGGLVAGCRGQADPTPDEISSPGDGDFLSLFSGQPGSGSVVAHLPRGFYRLSPTGRYVTTTESRDENPGLMFYRPNVYDVGALLEADTPPLPFTPAPAVPDAWVTADDTRFEGWVLEDRGLVIGSGSRVVLWSPETGETVLLEHPLAPPGQSVYHGGAVSPDGRSLALAVSGPDGMIRLERVVLQPSAELAGVQCTWALLTDLGERTEYPGASGFPYETAYITWAPDGLTLAVSIERREDGADTASWSWEVLMVRVDPVSVTVFARQEVVRGWSPDGAYLVLEPTPGGRPWRVTTLSGQAVLTVEAAGWSWAPAGKAVLTYENEWSFIVSLPDGAKEPLVRGRAIGRLPDGRWLWLTPLPGP